MNTDHLGNCLHCGKPVGTSGYCACRGILPESKPEPKNCGNCAHGNKPLHTTCVQCAKQPGTFALWEAKAAEPQVSGESILERKIADCLERMETSVKDLARTHPDAVSFWATMQAKIEVGDIIRAEIERVREEEKQAVITRIEDVRQSCYGREALNPSPSTFIFSVMEDIKQNKHRSEK